MKKFTTFLWILILSAIGFLAYDQLKPTPDTEAPGTQTITTEQPSSTKTALQKEVESESVKTTQSYSVIIQNGDKFRQSGYLNEAIASYKQALSLSPDAPDILSKLGETYLENNLPAEARLYFQQLKEIKDTPENEVMIGRTYMNNREIEEAKKHFDSLVAQTAQTSAAQSLTQDENVRYYSAIIKILYKDYDNAKKDLNALIADEKVSKATKDKANIYLEAFKTFNLFKEGKPDHLEAVLAKAFIDTNEFGASIPLLYDVISIRNNYRDAWIMLGYSYLQTGKTEDSISAFDKAKELDPAKPQTLFFLGMAYAVQDKYDNAIEYFNQSLESGFEPKSLIEQKLADIYLIKKDYEKALISYEALIKEGIVDKNIFTKTIWICIEKTNQAEKAVSLGQTLVKAMPDDPASYNLRGWAYTAQGDYVQAKDDLIQSLKLNPKFDSAYLNLGWMYEKQNMIATAKEYYRKAYSLGNGNSISTLAAIRFNNILRADITSPTSVGTPASTASPSKQ